MAMVAKVMVVEDMMVKGGSPTGEMAEVVIATVVGCNLQGLHSAKRKKMEEREREVADKEDGKIGVG